MKAKSSPEASLQEHTNLSAVTSSSPSASVPSIALPFKEIDTSNTSQSQDLEVRELAYKIYEQRGRLDGQALQDWLDAEAIVRQGGKVAA